MRYIDRRFLLPIAAATTAWAQQQSPETVKAEAELRARAQQFFQLQVDKKYRQAEAFVAEDTKDNYYGGNKFNIKGFTIQKIELLSGNEKAIVTMSGSVTLAMPVGGAVQLDAPSTTLWKIENGQWVMYVDTGAGVNTPFGPMKALESNATPPARSKAGKAPDVGALQNPVTVDRNSLVLSAEAPQQTITVLNNLPGGMDLELSADHLEGLTVSFEKKHLEAGEKTLIHFTANERGAGVKVVRILISPLGSELDIQVTKK
jgi:hypothetical protein